jgi:phosphatidylglycerophosphate synthase
MPEPSQAFSLDSYIYKILSSIAPRFCPSIITTTHITIINAGISLYILKLVIDNNYKNSMLVLCLFVLRVVLDMLDGTVARKCDKITKFGGWLDQTIDNIFYPLVFLAVLYVNGKLKSLLGIILFIIMYLYYHVPFIGDLIHDNTIILPFVFHVLKCFAISN